jgi:hypothetical protein
MPARLIKLVLGLPELETWGEWDNAFAFATIIPRLLAPETDRRRGRIRTLFYLALMQRAKRATDARGRELSEFLEDYCDRTKHRLIGTSTVRSYRNRLYLGTDAGTYIGKILTTGLTAKIMASPSGVAKGQRVLATAQSFIYDNYSTGIAIYANAHDTRRLWFTWKRVAHLCAAFVDFLPFTQSIEIDEQTLATLEENMARFATTAMYYQRFLTGQHVIDDAPIPERTRRSFKLALLPDLRLITEPYTNSELPPWDRRREGE